MKIYTLNDILKTEHLGHERYIRIEEYEADVANKEIGLLKKKETLWRHLLLKGIHINDIKERISWEEEVEQTLKEK